MIDPSSRIRDGWLSNLPVEFVTLRDRVQRILAPIKPADKGTSTEGSFLFTAKRTEASRDLPQYYLLYFLLVDLLEFKNIGQFEKIAWSVPIDYKGEAFLIEHRKFGVGIFAKDLNEGEVAAREIVNRLQRAVREARPFFDWVAKQAVEASRVNVVNNGQLLSGRFQFFLDSYRLKSAEGLRRKDEFFIKESNLPDGTPFKRIEVPILTLRKQASWLALAAIHAFFSWTEHIFIHMAILLGRVGSAGEISRLAGADWADKFRAAFDIRNLQNKVHFDKLILVRKGLRNSVEHGAFGKDGEAFRFHSGAGAVPVLLPHNAKSRKFVLGDGLSFDEEGALKVIQDFICHLWADERAPARIYLQECDLPIIFTYTQDGTYQQAMKSEEAMKELVEYLNELSDRSSNMDW